MLSNTKAPLSSSSSVNLALSKLTRHIVCKIIFECRERGYLWLAPEYRQNVCEIKKVQQLRIGWKL
jgi:hypothetical protein